MIAVGAPLKILLVEDRALDAELVTAALERTGTAFFPMRLVATRAQFIEELDHSPDLILCDYSLPGFNAMEALDLLKERKLHIPFIIISGSIGEETAVEAIKAGADDYLLKDRLGRLGTAISHAVEEKQLRAAAHLAEEHLRQSEFKYRCLFEHLLDAAFLCDSSTGRIIDCNQRSGSLLGRERSAILGVRFGQFVPPDAWSALQTFASTKSDAETEFYSRIFGVGGADIPVQISATIVEIYHRQLLFIFLRSIERKSCPPAESGERSAVNE
jgi:PAS domain S-box-containing protein